MGFAGDELMTLYERSINQLARCEDDLLRKLIAPYHDDGFLMFLAKFSKFRSQTLCRRLRVFIGACFRNPPEGLALSN
jgi:hypothetical protein